MSEQDQKQTLLINAVDVYKNAVVEYRNVQEEITKFRNQNDLSDNRTFKTYQSKLASLSKKHHEMLKKEATLLQTIRGEL